MLVTNQRLDQLAAAQTDFLHRGMLSVCMSLLFMPHSCQFSQYSALATVNGDTLTATMEDSDSHLPQVSIPDEDPLDEAVTDPNVLAKVTFSKKPRMFPLQM